MVKRKVKVGSIRKSRTLSNSAQKISGMSELSVNYALRTPSIANYAQGMKAFTTACSQLHCKGVVISGQKVKSRKKK